jgi:inorganic pyrophosphatase
MEANAGNPRMEVAEVKESSACQHQVLTQSLSFEIARTYLGAVVTVIIDRPLGSRHPEHRYIYEVNYGFIAGTCMPDGEELDAYFLGPRIPLQQARGMCIAIAHREDDDDDKLIVVPIGIRISTKQIRRLIQFQEKYFNTQIIRQSPLAGRY